MSAKNDPVVWIAADSNVSFKSLEVEEETSEFVFNSSDLTIESCTIKSEALKTEQVQTTTNLHFDKEKERVTAKFTTPIPKGSKAQLQLGWEGKLTNNMTGKCNITFSKMDIY